MGEAAKIDEENLAAIAKMSPQQIEEERQKILQDPGLLAFLKARKNNRRDEDINRALASSKPFEAASKRSDPSTSENIDAASESLKRFKATVSGTDSVPEVDSENKSQDSSSASLDVNSKNNDLVDDERMDVDGANPTRESVSDKMDCDPPVDMSELPIPPAEADKWTNKNRVGFTFVCALIYLIYQVYEYIT